MDEGIVLVLDELQKIENKNKKSDGILKFFDFRTECKHNETKHIFRVDGAGAILNLHITSSDVSGNNVILNIDGKTLEIKMKQWNIIDNYMEYIELENLSFESFIDLRFKRELAGMYGEGRIIGTMFYTLKEK